MYFVVFFVYLAVYSFCYHRNSIRVEKAQVEFSVAEVEHDPFFVRKLTENGIGNCRGLLTKAA
jgi:hypothetical protein